MVTTGEKFIALRIYSVLEPVDARSVAPRNGALSRTGISLATFSLLRCSSAADVLVDFATAFPALGSACSFAVLQEMPVPAFLNSILLVLCTDLRTDFKYSGVNVAT